MPLERQRRQNTRAPEPQDLRSADSYRNRVSGTSIPFLDATSRAAASVSFPFHCPFVPGGRGNPKMKADVGNQWHIKGRSCGNLIVATKSNGILQEQDWIFPIYLDGSCPFRLPPRVLKILPKFIGFSSCLLWQNSGASP